MQKSHLLYAMNIKLSEIIFIVVVSLLTSCTHVTCELFVLYLLTFIEIFISRCSQTLLHKDEEVYIMKKIMKIGS